MEIEVGVDIGKMVVERKVGIKVGMRISKIWKQKKEKKIWKKL